MNWFQFLAFFMAMLAVGCYVADNYVGEIIDIIIAKKKGE